MSKKRNIKKNSQKKVEQAKVKNVNLKDDNKTKTVITTFIAVIAVSLLGYAIVYAYTNKDNTANEDVIENAVVESDVNVFATDVDGNKIAAEETFNQVEDDYIVFFVTEDTKAVYDDFVDLNGKTAEGSNVTYYYVNMDEKINEAYLYDWEAHREEYGDIASAKNSSYPKSIEELQIADLPSAIRITNGQINTFYQGQSRVESIYTSSQTSY